MYMYEFISAAVLLMIMTIALDVLGRANEYATGNRLRCRTATQRSNPYSCSVVFIFIVL